MRAALAVLAALALGCAAHFPSAPVALSTGLEPSVVAIVNERGAAYCSGTITYYGILTAAHCVDDEETVIIGTADEYDGDENLWFGSRHATVLRRDFEADLALIEWHDHRHALSLASRSPTVGERVHSLGHPAGFGYVYSEGVATTSVRHDQGRSFYLVSLGVYGGMSGSSVLDSNGDVCGVVSFVLAGFVQTYPHLGGVLSAESVARFLTAR